jgi:phosphonate transport system permease protein
MNTNASKLPPIPDHIRNERRVLAVTGTILTGAILISLILSEFFSWNRWSEALPAIWHLGTESVPPDWSVADKLWKGAFESTIMSLAGTFIAVAISLPLSFLAARNIVPFQPVVFFVRSIFNLLRSIPELIMAIVFVAAVGFGVLAGVMALGLHSIGMVGKFFADSIETVDEDLVEAVKSTGANRFQVIYYGVLPQVIDRFIDISLYRWEYNFRASTIVGIVGAGGVGFQIVLSLRLMQYQQLTVGLLAVLLMVVMVDSVGNFIRSRFFKGETANGL